MASTIASMRQGIIQFENCQHLAWDDSQLFAKRIKALPLLFLEFIHPAQDPKTQSTTVTHYVPCRNEFCALADLIRSYGSDLRVCDIGCGNGFLGSLLMREGVSGFGIDDSSYRQPQIPHFYDPDCYQVIKTNLHDLKGDFDVSMCSWMSEGSNLTPAIVARKPALIIHFYSKDHYPDGSLTTGTVSAYKCPENYRLLTGWETRLPQDYFMFLMEEEIRLQMYENPFRNRSVCVYLRNDIDSLPPPSPLDYSERYDWDLERELINSLRKKRGLDECLLEVSGD